MNESKLSNTVKKLRLSEYSSLKIDALNDISEETRYESLTLLGAYNSYNDVFEFDYGVKCNMPLSRIARRYNNQGFDRLHIDYQLNEKAYILDYIKKIIIKRIRVIKNGKKDKK